MRESKKGSKLPRAVNFRFLPLLAVGITVTVLLRVLCGRSAAWGIVLRVVYAAGMATFLVLFLVRKKKYAAVVTAVLMGVCLLTGLSYDVRSAVYHTVTPQAGTVYAVEGTAESVSQADGTLKSVVLTDVTIDKKEVRGKLRLYFNDDVSSDTLTVGDAVSCTGVLYAVPPIDVQKPDGTNFRKNIRYRMSAGSDAFTIKPSLPRGLTALRQRIKRRLQNALGNDYGAIAFGMLTGEKDDLGDETARVFNASGLGHVLAVSGLHVGILSGVFLFLLRKCKLPRPCCAAITMALLLLYTVFVGATASVLRALLMSAVMLAAFLCGERRDTLSSLSLAYCLLLTYAPFYLFEVGFLLSFSAVYGLALFYRPFTAALKKIRMPTFLAKPLATSAAVQVSTFPVFAYFFAKTQTYMLLFNLLFLPVLTATFVVLIFLLPLLFFFNLTTLLKFAGFGIAFVDMGAGLATQLPYNTLPILSHAGLFALYPLYFAASRFLLLPARKKQKYACSTCIAVCCALIGLVPTLCTRKPGKRLAQSVIPVYAFNDVTSIVVDGGVTVVGDVCDAYALQRALHAFGIRKVDVMVLNRLTEQNGRALAALSYELEIGRIYCPLACTDPEGLAALGEYKQFYLYEDDCVQKLTQVRGENGKHLGYVYAFSDRVQMLTVSKSARYTAVPQSVLRQTPIIRCSLYTNAVPERVYLTNLPRGYLGEVPKYQYAPFDNGLFAYKVFTGELLK